MEPITREEQFMAAAAQGKTDLTPITRQENFLRKIAEAVGGSGSGGMGGADWNASEGEPGHVLNRTHWSEKSLTDTAEWDGDLTGRESVVFSSDGTHTLRWVKLSDTYLTMEQLDGAVITFTTPSEDNTFTVSAEMMKDASEDFGVPCVSVSEYVVSLSDSATFLGFAQLTRGLWAIHSASDEATAYISSIKTVNSVLVSETVHKLDKKFLPDDIGGGSDIVVVKITSTDGENYVADMSASEIMAEVQSGKIVCASVMGSILNPISYSGGAVLFSALTVSEGLLVHMEISVNEDKTIERIVNTYTITPAT